MLYLIGLGLGDAADITVKGLQALRSCSRVYLEAYTSILTVGKEALVSRSTLTDPRCLVDFIYTAALPQILHSLLYYVREGPTRINT